MRYESLEHDTYDAPFKRPWILVNQKAGESFLLQLQPTLSPNEDRHDVGLTSWVQLDLTNSLVIVNEIRLRYASQNDSSYIGKDWRGGSGETNQGFLFWHNTLGQKGQMTLQAGRFYSQLGPGRHGQLLLGANSRPMDQLALSLAHPFSNNLSVRFFFQTSALDKIGINNRFMSLHRLDLIGKNWYVAMSEALTYTRNNQGIDLVYLNPFLFYHGEQLNGPGLSGNTIGTLEFGYKWKTNHLYGEFLIDDVQLDNEVIGDLEPNELGGLLGYEYAGNRYYLSVEGIAITNRTYKTPDKSEWYLHRNRPIGYELGSDIARLNLMSRYYLKYNWHIDAELDMIWQGEGNMGKAWDTPWEDPSVTVESGYSESFPTEIVQKSTEISVELMRHWDRERWISLGISYLTTKNKNNITEMNENGLNIHLSASWTLKYEAIFDD